jgi:hypothetical protein
MKLFLPEIKKSILSATISALTSALPKLNKHFTQRALFLRHQVMKSSPSYPLICFTSAQSVRVYFSAEEFQTVRLSDFQYQTPGQFIFDSKGMKWRFQYKAPPFPINFWNELRNPEYKASLICKFKGPYSLEDLKLQFIALLDKNDDVLTEHESPSFLKSLINSSLGFEAILDVLKKYVFEVNEPELWQEQEQRKFSGE